MLCEKHAILETKNRNKCRHCRQPLNIAEPYIALTPEPGPEIPELMCLGCDGYIDRHEPYLGYSNDLTCLVCLNAGTLRMNHATAEGNRCVKRICEDCAEAWFKDHGTCPHCRQEVNTRKPCIAAESDEDEEGEKKLGEGRPSVTNVRFCFRAIAFLLLLFIVSRDIPTYAI